jgi:glycosyltransferase involved in cell wall biosynthesis
MKVLVNALSVSGGGGASVARGLVPALARRRPGDAYHVLARDDELERMTTWPGNVGFEIVSGMASNLARIRWEQRSLRRRLEGGAYDVHLNLAGFGVLARGLPQILLVRNAYFFVDERWMPWRSRVRLRIQRAFQVAAWRRGADAVCVSRYMRDLLDAYGRDDAGRTWIVPHGLDARFLGAAPGEPADGQRLRLLWIGNARPHKRLPLFAGALPAITARVGRQVHVRMVGSFPEDLVQRLSRTDEVHGSGSLSVSFPGHAGVAGLVDHYRWADVYVSTSALESFDNCVAEAQAVGVPIVATDIPVHVEYGGDAVELYRTDDVAALVSAVARVADDGDLQREMRRRGRALVAGRSWDDVAVRYHEVLDAVVGERGR